MVQSSIWIKNHLNIYKFKNKNLMQKNVICLIAPTASGKTALAYELYDTGKYSLISVDSALIYRDMNIGTAKPTAEELTKYPHALVDIIDPTESYSVAQFVTDTKREIDLAHAQGKTPVLVGGTMMYYMALLEGIADIPATLPATREQVLQMFAEQGNEQVHDFLKQHDPILAEKFLPSDTQRVGRAVEVFLQTGRALSDWQQQPNIALADNPDQNWQVFAVIPDRTWLHQRIDLRLQIMWQQGFLQEVSDLKNKYDLHPDMPSMRCVGYRQVWDYLEKIAVLKSENLSNAQFIALEQEYRQTMQNEALYATRQLAKRQYTWLRKLTTSPQIAERVGFLQVFDTALQAKIWLI